jgi:endonuclease/exonuclease/phosphatase family metal-dependent hydrolase
MSLAFGKRPPLKVFFCYAHEDRRFREELDLHLDMLEREGLIAPWFDGRIAPGTEWSLVIEKNLRGADLVIFLVSKAFLRSKYIAEVEMRLAWELHIGGKLRVVPVLLERIPGFKKLPFSKLEALPSKARPILQWKDRVRAFEDVTVGIRRAAINLIIDSGGPFEFCSHHFLEAELAHLKPKERDHTLRGLQRLRTALSATIPMRRLEKNLLVASWSLHQFGRDPLLPESYYYMAQIISAFDIVALQEIDRNLQGLHQLIQILGPEWAYLITDLTEGRMGNNERFALVYYQPRVAFEHISGEVVLPDNFLIQGKQFARKPLLASFRSGQFQFRLCTAHIHFGGGTPQARAHSLLECQTLASFLARTARRDGHNLILAGNFNIENPKSASLRIIRKEGITVPGRILHPTNLRHDKYYDLIGFCLNQQKESPTVKPGRSGAFDPYQCVFLVEDWGRYMRRAGAFPRKPVRNENSAPPWVRKQLSDHLPLWVEFKLARSPFKKEKGRLLGA